MNKTILAPILAFALWGICVLECQAQPVVKDPSKNKTGAKATLGGEAGKISATANGAGSKPATTAKTTTSAKTKKPKYPAFGELLENAKIISGLLKMYHKDTKLYAEIPTSQLNKDFIVVISIARGIGRRPLFGGMSWGFGDDWIWQFRKADDRIQIVRRNVRFRAAKGTPQEESVYLAYTDSVLFSLPIATKAPSGAPIVELTSVFKSDLPQISNILSGFTFSKDKSSWAAVKGFRDNVEIEVAATYTSTGKKTLETVADSRGATIHIHYSISELPQIGYKPRPADDRIGHFVTAIKDYSKQDGYDRFVRYVDRWDLQKAEPTAELSPPKSPIIFWIEKTVPFKYRKAIREGILQWNKAFEKAGFANAIEVRQQPADATWDPEDINYNTFRWITAGAAFAIGPSRVNPKTGQILDADILFDADFLQQWQEDFDVVTPEKLAALTGGPLDVNAYQPGGQHDLSCDCSRLMGRQLAFGSAVLAEGNKPLPKELLEELLQQAVKATTIHEVGHTLGLRHNFKASTFLTLEELGNPEKTKNTGLAASVMDYLPMNIAPKGEKQGDYFGTTIGPYDYWAIEYAYKPCSDDELKKIASLGAEPGHDYGTDGDARGYDPDPLVNRYDLGKDPIRFARRRVKLINEVLPDLVERMTPEGENYHQARRAFNILLSDHASGMRFAARFIGGIYVHRDHKGDPNARPPYVIVDRKKQDEAMKLLETEVFGPKSYQFPPELYNYLGHERWSHWGTEILPRVDYPIHQVMSSWQDRVFDRLLSSTTLSRLVDSEMKVPADKPAFTAAELLERLTAAIFSELGSLDQGKFTNRKPAIGSFRRSTQRRYFERLANMAMGNTRAPEDCQSMAYVELESLQEKIKKVLEGKAELDPYTRAHLREISGRIGKVLEARLQLPGP